MKLRNIVGAWTLGVVLLAGMLLATPVLAQVPHPHYLHALSDLRHARWLLSQPTGSDRVEQDEQWAIGEIDKAIGEINRAAINDGKNVYQPEPTDSGVDYRGRVHQSRDLLDAAHRDLSFMEGNPASLGWRNAALRHIDAAHQAVDRALHHHHW